MKKSILFSFLILGICGTAYGGQSRLELKDGSVIQGEIVSMSNQTYTITNESMGTIQISADKIRSISVAESNATPSSPSSSNSKQEAALKTRMMNDPAIMSEIKKLAGDPEMIKAMQDPAILAAVMSGNTEALQSNENLMKIAQNPVVQNIHKKVSDEDSL